MRVALQSHVSGRARSDRAALVWPGGARAANDGHYLPPTSTGVIISAPPFYGSRYRRRLRPNEGAIDVDCVTCTDESDGEAN